VEHVNIEQQYKYTGAVTLSIHGRHPAYAQVCLQTRYMESDHTKVGRVNIPVHSDVLLGADAPGSILRLQIVSGIPILLQS
jgi:hypothetical protein